MKIGARNKGRFVMRHKKDDRGYSLIELLMVIAIMAIFIGFITYSFALVSGKEAKKCANNISIALDKTKNYSLVKSGTNDVYLAIKKDGNNGYLAEYYFPKKPLSAEYRLYDSELISKKADEISCNVNGNVYMIEGNTELRIFYDRITGAFKDAMVVSGGTKVEQGICSSIKVKRWKVYQLDLISSTGKHTINKIN